jgi:hypothetical protein
MHEDSQPQPPATEGEWQAFSRNWRKSYEAWLDREVETQEAAACRSVAIATARSTLEWCKANPEDDLDEINEKVWRAARLVHELHQALTDYSTAKQTLKSNSILWRHVDIGKFISLSNNEEKDDPFNARAAKNISNTYIANPWMQNPYVDWVFIDSLMFACLMTHFQLIMKSKYGFGYALFGKRWKANLFRLFSVPTTFIFGWIAPGALCWWLYGKLPTPAIVIAGLYYASSIFMLIRDFARLALYRLRTGKTPRQEIIDRVSAIELAYAELREETIHVPSLRRAIEQARDKGVLWDPQIFSILDNVAAKTPTTWTRQQIY